MFLFEKNLTPYIYSVFWTLISLAQSSQSGQLLCYEQTRQTDRHTLAPIWAASRPWATTPERHQGVQRPPHHRQRAGHLHTMSNHTPNGIKAHNINRFREADGRTLAPSGMPHALHRAPSVPSRTPSPARVCVRIYLQVLPYPHHSNGLQCGGCFFSLVVCSKSQLALTVKNITCFQGFDLRIAVFEKFRFWDIYLEQKNIKTAHFSALKQPKTILKQKVYRLSLHQNNKTYAMSCI